jgi:hypothetical protein
MGVWGTSAFDNDEAVDWLYRLDAEGDELLLKTLEQITGCHQHLEASVCFEGVAAAEIVAALKNRDASNLPDVARQWVCRQDKPPEDNLVQLAQKAVSRIKMDSELKDLWSESGGIMEWIGALEILEKRLDL